MRDTSMAKADRRIRKQHYYRARFCFEATPSTRKVARDFYTRLRCKLPLLSLSLSE